MNEALNGIAVAAWRNQPNHNLYNQRVQELFLAVSRNYSSSVTHVNGTIVRTMANGSTIMYRTVSGSGFAATIELNFPQIWSSIRILKFQ